MMDYEAAVPHIKEAFNSWQHLIDIEHPSARDFEQTELHVNHHIKQAIEAAVGDKVLYREATLEDRRYRMIRCVRVYPEAKE